MNCSKFEEKHQQHKKMQFSLDVANLKIRFQNQKKLNASMKTNFAPFQRVRGISMDKSERIFYEWGEPRLGV